MIHITDKKNKINVLPVYPQFPTTFWSYKHAIEFVGKKAIMPPTGLATVAAMLPPEHFNVLPVCDLNIEPLDENALEEADLVFTSTMIVQQIDRLVPAPVDYVMLRICFFSLSQKKIPDERRQRNFCLPRDFFLNWS